MIYIYVTSVVAGCEAEEKGAKPGNSGICTGQWLHFVCGQHIASIVQCVEECVKHMAGVADLQTCQVRSLMICSFHVLKGSYSHCQVSAGW